MTFRIFVSSTFGDLVEERTVLQREVFPRIAAFCRDRGARFQAIDLRWGISAEAARDRRTMEICLAEVRRCREASPALNFIALIGSRYGWRPLPSIIAAVDFDAIASAADLSDRRLLRRAYCRDDNAIVPHWRLLPQPEGGTEAKLLAREEALRAALDRALAAAFAATDARRRTYGASATELEIAERLALDPYDRGAMLCYLRSAGRVSAIAATDSARLAALKAELGRRLDADHVHCYRAGAKGVWLDAWRERVEDDLLAAVRRALRSRAHRPQADAHASFAAAVARDAVGQRWQLDRIRRYLEDGGPTPLLVYGVAGSGKSTLVARAWRQARDAGASATAIARFVGATPDSTSLETLLRSLCVEIDTTLGQTNELPAGTDALGKALVSRFTAASVERPLWIFIDGLEQVESQGARLAWLPTLLPPHARIVLSAVADDGAAGDALREMRSRWPHEAFMRVGRLRVAEADHLLERWLAAKGRRLQPRQRAAALAAWAGCPLPLYLRLVAEQARHWRSFDEVAALAGNIMGMLGGVFARLAGAAEHGRTIVRASLGLLCAARRGLAEEELLVLLADDPMVMDELSERSPHWPLDGSLPFVVWARLHADLAPYLVVRTADGIEVLAFFHGALRRAAEDFADAGGMEARHTALARYFTGDVAPAPQPLRFAAGVPNRRKLSELAFQQTEARDWPALIATLTNLEFLQVKCSASLTGDLIGDYDRAAAKDRSGATTALAEWRSFVVRERAAFDSHAGIDGFVLQQAQHQEPAGAVAKAWQRCDPVKFGLHWWRLDERHGADDAVLATLERHAKGVTDCGFDASGQLLFSSGMDGAVLAWRSAEWSLIDVVAELPASADSIAVSSDGTRIGSACADGVVRIHDRRTRRTIECEGRFEMAPRRCRFVDDGRQLLAVGGRGIRLFDAASGSLIARDLDDSIINDCTATNGALVTLGDCEGRVVVYDLARRTIRHEFFLNDVRRVQGSQLAADGRRVLAAGGRFNMDDGREPFGASGVWDLSDESEIDDQRLPKPALNCLYIDGERSYVVGMLDGKMRVHSSSDHRLVREIAAHHNGVRGLALSPDGETLVSGSFDGRLIAWRTAALVASQHKAATRGQGLFCVVSADGVSGWTLHGSVDRMRASIAVETFGGSPPAATPERSRALADLPLQRQDPGAPMQVYETAFWGLGERVAHRGSPPAGDGTYWIVHSGARMWPSQFHCLPALPIERWSKHNAAWARASDGQTCVVRAALARTEGATCRHFSLLWFDDDRFMEPQRSFEFELALNEPVGVCHFSGDGRSVRLACGAAIIEFNRDGGCRRLVAGESPVTAFCESRDRRWLIAGHAGGAVQAWYEGAPVRRLYAHRGEVVDLVFVDAQHFATAGKDGTVRLWSTAQGRCEAVFVARSALAAIDAAQCGGRLLALDVQGNGYWLRACPGGGSRWPRRRPG